MSNPFFSVVITTYERASIVGRCIASCLGQEADDFELVVVDDGSTDGTAAMLARCEDPRLRVVVHDRNRGINPARHSGVAAARGEWVVVVDSDDELVPGALRRLRKVIAGLPAGVRVVRSRNLHDDGRVTPAFVPAEPYGYEGRIRWAEAEGGGDAGRCIRRDVFEACPYIANRRGAMETLFELDLAKAETSICVEDVLGLIHADAADSWLRNSDRRSLSARLRREAADMLWMAETALARHGAVLARWGPRQHAALLRLAAQQAFLLGQRRRGGRYGLRALRRRPLDPLGWATLGLGMLGPRWAVLGALAYRRLPAWLLRASSRGRRMPPNSATASNA